MGTGIQPDEHILCGKDIEADTLHWNWQRPEMHS